MIYIASLNKYVGKIQEDILICDFLTSTNKDVKIKDFYEIEPLADEEDTVLLKSIWGYHENPDKFIASLKSLEKNKVKLINDYKYIYWNIDKYKYLQDLEYLGIVPTYLLAVNRTSSVDEIRILIDDICRIYSVSMVVIKPAISASGFLTSKYEFKKDNKEVLEEIYKNREKKFIVQPYRSSISQGEISLVLFNGKQKYGVNRFPGVLRDKKEPVILSLESIPKQIKNKGNEICSFFKERFYEPPSICRIDFVKNKNKFEIIEVELIDPSLSFKELPENLREDALNSLLSSFKNE